jgi:hypothetical protein
MKALNARFPLCLVPLIAVLAAAPAAAQVPVDDDGAPLADFESFDFTTPAGNEDIPLLTQTELQELVGPIALYPDDLLAIVLPASTYPLQLVQAQRFLEDLEDDPSLKPDESWDDSVIAVLNYPEVVALLNEDLDWTWRLGEAVVAQQADVVGAVEGFRDRAYAAGNLKSDTRQTVARNEGTIEITPVEDDVIYVPYYEPERIVHYQSRPVYHYYPRAYPVYYYPYPVGYAFNSGFFWGVTTAFTVGWLTDSVHVVHHSYHGHPYYGHRYWDGWWYRRPTIHVHNNYYSSNHYSVSRHRYSRGDHWRPRHDTRRRLHNQRITRSDYYTGRNVRHRSHSSNRSYANTRNHDVERRRSVRTATTDNSRHQRQAAVPTTSRQAQRDVEQRQRSHVQTRPSQPERTARREQRGNDYRQERRRETRPERRVEEQQRSHVQTQLSRPERSARREQRGSDYRQERRAATARRQESQRSAQRPVKEKKSVRRAEHRKHAASRDGSARRQRH